MFAGLQFDACVGVAARFAVAGLGPGVLFFLSALYFAVGLFTVITVRSEEEDPLSGERDEKILFTFSFLASLRTNNVN